MTLTPKELEIKERCERLSLPLSMNGYEGNSAFFCEGIDSANGLSVAMPSDPFSATFVFHDTRQADDLRNVLNETPALLSTISTLREENRRLKDALTPSTETKAAYMGEFTFDLETREGVSTLTVPWTTIKEIMSAIFTYAGFGRVEPGFNQEGVSPGAKQL